jgi:myo-inositol-1(or 4)-monophosphatase
MLEGSEAIQTANIEEKKNSVDLVTEYDIKVENLVQKWIAKEYPSFKFVGEESYSSGHREPLTDEPTFCVDPIDGTSNFIHGFPFACISIGLISKKRPVLGVIYNPFLNHMYYGVKGQGSFLVKGADNPLKLPLASPKPLDSIAQALIAVEWGHDRALPAMKAKSASFHKLAGDPSRGVDGGRMAHSLRSLGSAALQYCMVAQGGLDIYWEIGCWPWDVCAGIVIAQEAGCTVTGSHASFKETHGTKSFGDVTEEVLTGRKYAVIRPIKPTSNETSLQAQARVLGELYEAVEDMETV